MDAFPPPLPAGSPAPKPVHPARGWFLIVIGVCLSAGIALIGNAIYQDILLDRAHATHAHWKGSAELTRTVFELFGAIFVFGLMSVAAGIYVLRTRRLNRVLGAGMVGLLVVMGYFAYTISNATR